MDTIVGMLPIAAIVTYTTSGSTTLRAARERPNAAIVSLTPSLATARRLTLAWGVYGVHTSDVTDVAEMVSNAIRTVRDEGFAQAGESILISAGMPFGTPGATNLLRIAQV
jgi:pyruvate kinase